MGATKINVNVEFRRIFFDECLELISEFEAALLRLHSDRHLAGHLSKMLRCVVTVRGSSMTAGYEDFSGLVAVVESLVRVYQEYGVCPDADHQKLLMRCATALRQWLEILKQNPEDQDQPFGVASLIMDARTAVSEQTAALRNNANQSDAQKSKFVQENENQKSRATIKVDVEKIDTVMDLCGELVVIKSQLEQHAAIQGAASDAHLQSVLSLLGNTIRDVYDRAMSMRLVALKPSIMRLERVVREAAAKLNKSIAVSVEGEDLEVDRTIIEQIADPLMHICRNAVDHGIESTQERVRKGKSEIGRLSFKAFNEGSNVVIEISDDGNGIDRASVLAHARSKGVISALKQDQHITDDEVYQLLFAPGFSTASVVSDISGRGVGLDVVLSTVRALKGDISIKSTLGVGSTFRIMLPLSTSLTDGIVVEVGDQTYVLPLAIVSEFVSLGQENTQTVKDHLPVLRLREQYVPVVRLAEVFAVSGASPMGVALITKSPSGPLALVVDRVVGQRQIVMKKVDDAVHSNRLVAGAAVMGNGRVVLVVDPSAVTLSELGVNHG